VVSVLLILFGASLTACTFTRQFPALGPPRKWKFYTSPASFRNWLSVPVWSNSRCPHWLIGLKQKRYRIFQEGIKLYARKGIVGTNWPYCGPCQHVADFAGGHLGSHDRDSLPKKWCPVVRPFKFAIFLMLVPGQRRKSPKDWAVRVNRFWIDYTPEGAIDQFYSDLSVINQMGKAEAQNHPRQ
jgi:cytochrome c biogenesis protein